MREMRLLSLLIRQQQWRSQRIKASFLRSLATSPCDSSSREGARGGFIHEDKERDVSRLVKVYSAEALASAVRDREDMLQACAQCLETGDLERMKQVLLPYRRQRPHNARRERRTLDLHGGFSRKHLLQLRSRLQSLPEHVDIANEERAAVVVPLCNVDGVASVLFERRAAGMRRFSSQVCFPGGMVDETQDDSVLETSLRELYEEVGIDSDHVEVLGVLRVDWADLAAITGVAVTPVIGFLGNIDEDSLKPNVDEVMELFTIPLKSLLNKSRWSVEKHCTPVFNGGPHPVWGLTAQILYAFVSEFFWEGSHDVVEDDGNGEVGGHNGGGNNHGR